MGHPLLFGQNSATIVSEGLKNNIKPDDWGVWNIYGEDENCDLGGPHSNPLITTYEGTLRNAAIHAVSLPRYKTWGGGGYIQRTEIDHGSCEIPSDDPVAAALKRVQRAIAELDDAQKHALDVKRKASARADAETKLKPILTAMNNDELNVAIEVFTKLVKDYTK
jgi:hypothetical protein